MITMIGSLLLSRLPAFGNSCIEKPERSGSSSSSAPDVMSSSSSREMWLLTGRLCREAECTSPLSGGIEEHPDPPWPSLIPTPTWHSQAGSQYEPVQCSTQWNTFLLCIVLQQAPQCAGRPKQSKQRHAEATSEHLPHMPSEGMPSKLRITFKKVCRWFRYCLI
jgi:hypothetical protein